jgi:hypothetical protein
LRRGVPLEADRRVHAREQGSAEDERAAERAGVIENLLRGGGPKSG